MYLLVQGEPAAVQQFEERVECTTNGSKQLSKIFTKVMRPRVNVRQCGNVRSVTQHSPLYRRRSNQSPWQVDTVASTSFNLMRAYGDGKNSSLKSTNLYQACNSSGIKTIPGMLSANLWSLSLSRVQPSGRYLIVTRILSTVRYRNSIKLRNSNTVSKWGPNSSPST